MTFIPTPETRDLMRQARENLQRNGLSILEDNWVYNPFVHRWINMNGTIMLELDPETGIVSLWRRARCEYAAFRTRVSESPLSPKSSTVIP